MAGKSPLLKVAVLCPLSRDREFLKGPLLDDETSYDVHFMESKLKYSSRFGIRIL